MVKIQSEIISDILLKPMFWGFLWVLKKGKAYDTGTHVHVEQTFNGLISPACMEVV